MATIGPEKPEVTVIGEVPYATFEDLQIILVEYPREHVRENIEFWQRRLPDAALQHFFPFLDPKEAMWMARLMFGREKAIRYVEMDFFSVNDFDLRHFLYLWQTFRVVGGQNRMFQFIFKTDRYKI